MKHTHAHAPIIAASGELAKNFLRMGAMRPCLPAAHEMSLYIELLLSPEEQRLCDIATD